jgi:hypothetical protein
MERKLTPELREVRRGRRQRRGLRTVARSPGRSSVRRRVSGWRILSVASGIGSPCGSPVGEPRACRCVPELFGEHVPSRSASRARRRGRARASVPGRARAAGGGGASPARAAAATREPHAPVGLAVDEPLGAGLTTPSRTRLTPIRRASVGFHAPAVALQLVDLAQVVPEWFAEVTRSGIAQPPVVPGGHDGDPGEVAADHRAGAGSWCAAST